MDPSQIIQLITIIILLAMSAFFSSSETALTTVSTIRLKSLADNGSKNAKLVLTLKENPDKMLSAILIGNNIVNIAASSITTIFVQTMWGSWAISIGSGALTLLVLVFGEITPKTAATGYADKFSLVVAKPIWFLTKVLTPIIVVVNFLASCIMKLFRININEKESTFTEEELRTIMDVSHEEGVIEEEEREMINNVFDFGEAEAKEIMIPRIDMCMINVDASYDELLEIFKENRYTRLPVYQDSTDNVIGIINIKDLILYRSGDKFDIRDYLRDVYYTYEYKKLDELMAEMRKDSVNITIVLDEYGAAVGLITIEDLLEEIVGEIRDEYDYDEEDSFKEIAPNEYLVDGQTKLDDVNDALDLSLTSEDYDSIGGYIIGSLDRLPIMGDTVETDNVKLVVELMNKNRIDKVHIYIKPETDEAEANGKE
ncbi:MAG: HlyC/CorC family transporter [Lachnospiraceae bacterium]|nr:HlyC/CorC family transporter [Lachnospiraceae bacterium]